MADWIVALCAAGALMVSLWNMRKIQELHIIVNSRLTELLKITAISARAEGHLQGLVEQAMDKPK